MTVSTLIDFGENMDKAQLVAKLPSYTKSILEALNAAGFEAYVVGGAVRELL